MTYMDNVAVMEHQRLGPQRQFSPWTDWVVGGRGRTDMTDNSAEIPFQSFLQEAIVCSSGMGRNVGHPYPTVRNFVIA